MTREEREDAIDYFKRSYASGNTDDERHHNEVLDTAIEALEQEHCDDCISRQATVKRLCKVGDFMNEKREGLGSPYIMAALLIQDNKDEFPSVTPKEKTGKWISFGIQGEIDGQIVRAFTCSKCGAISIFRVSNGNIVNGDLCPNCGARMVSE